ncbi:DUF4281 domain-containing protein [Altererythrobacter aurantiacus]|uniref:DUF4281 domain-containing protein n=1 Tax=Parapontixanthobacter aurantiacus TaxID=1463599 RepID=A0A844ZAI8_9SPHN|nr:DUF4281 domain-containing protein [Parapontixanthobacter aurantiacus]
MSWEGVFSFCNLLALACWIALVALPRRPFVLKAIFAGGVGLLSLAYTTLAIGLFSGAFDPVRDVGSAAVDLSDYSVDGLKNLFRSEGAIVIGWVHYLAFDLFVGIWLARDADRHRVSRLIQAPFLLLTFMAGPMGLLAWLLLRRTFGRKARSLR